MYQHSCVYLISCNLVKWVINKLSQIFFYFKLSSARCRCMQLGACTRYPGLFHRCGSRYPGLFHHISRMHSRCRFTTSQHSLSRAVFPGLFHRCGAPGLFHHHISRTRYSPDCFTGVALTHRWSSMSPSPTDPYPGLTMELHPIYIS